MGEKLSRRGFLKLGGLFGFAGGLISFITACSDLKLPPTPGSISPTETGPIPTTGPDATDTLPTVEPTPAPTQIVESNIGPEQIAHQLEVNQAFIEFWSQGKVENGTLFAQGTTRIQTRTVRSYKDENNLKDAVVVMQVSELQNGTEFTIPYMYVNRIKDLNSEQLKAELKSILQENDGFIPINYGPLFVTSGDNPNISLAADEGRILKVDLTPKVRAEIGEDGHWKDIPVLPENVVRAKLTELNKKELLNYDDTIRRVEEGLKEIGGGIVEHIYKDDYGKNYVTVLLNGEVRASGVLVSDPEKGLLVTLISRGQQALFVSKQVIRPLNAGEFLVQDSTGKGETEVLNKLWAMGNLVDRKTTFSEMDQLETGINQIQNDSKKKKPIVSVMLSITQEERAEIKLAMDKVGSSLRKSEIILGDNQITAVGVTAHSPNNSNYETAFRGIITDRFPTSDIQLISGEKALNHVVGGTLNLKIICWNLLYKIMGISIENMGEFKLNSYPLNRLLGNYLPSEPGDERSYGLAADRILSWLKEGNTGSKPDQNDIGIVANFVNNLNPFDPPVIVTT